MKRFMACLVFCVGASVAALAGPQHWGFGFSYLVTLEEGADGARALSAYEPPMHVKDGPWLLRWRDAAPQYADVLPNGLAVGDFWPEPMGGTEYLAALVQTQPAVPPIVRIYAAPQTFGTQAWRVVVEQSLPAAGKDLGGAPFVPQFVAAGDVLGKKRDQLVALYDRGSGEHIYTLVTYEPPAKPGVGAWTAALTDLPQGDAYSSADIAGLMVGDFWGDGHDCVALTLVEQGQTRVAFFELTADGLQRIPGVTTLSAKAQSANPPPLQGGAGGGSSSHEKTTPTPLPTSPQGGEGLENGLAAPVAFAAADFLKDGFAYVAALSTGPDVVFATAPRLPDKLYNTCWVRADETFAGAKLTGQAVGEGRQVMTGQRQAAYGKVVAATAGRVFGYITADVEQRKQKLWKPWQYHGYNDVEIAFTHRTPVYARGMPKKWQDGGWPWEPDEHFGWPLKDEEVTYEVSLKNNGPAPIPAGKVTLRAWVDTPERNADVLHPQAAEITFTVNEPIPPFDPAAPKYVVVPIKLKWPYDLEQPAGWSWKRINVRQVGERWLILRTEYAGDENERNDRYELALNSLLFRPVWRYDVDAPPHPSPDGIEGRPDRKINTLAYRAPCVIGDPESKEYNGRKLADAVQCMWERSRTSDGGDVWQRIVFDSYRLYDPEGRNGLKPLSREEDWLYYEGPREGEHWVGLWGDYERFDPRDGGAELHETGHLFHPLGDLYHYFINPTVTRRAPMADGSSVQINTYCWGLDSYCSGHAIIGEGGSDFQRYMEGARLALGPAWHRILPAKINVRVLDRDGQPIPQAKVTLWPYGDNKPFATGTTDAQGCWDPGVNRQPGDRYDIFNLPQYQDHVLDAIGHIFTVDFAPAGNSPPTPPAAGGAYRYSDFMVWGAEDVTAHSRYTLLQAALTHPDAWTWDFKTLYKAGAPAPRFGVTAAVRGREIVLDIQGSPALPYKVYRRWEPTYVYEPVATIGVPADKLAVYDSTSPPIQFRDDMGAQDWYTKGRYRAAYYVTEVVDGVESLPMRVYGIALDRVNGLSDLGDGRLMVSANCGKSEPFGVLCQGTTPVEETMKHFRFGHTAAKIVGSQANPQHYYATLASSDLPGMDRFFDLVQFDKPDRHNDSYPVVQNIAECDVAEFSATAPYTLALRPDRGASASINAGDWAFVDDAPARILAVDASGTQLTLDRALFKADQKEGLHVHIEFGGGTAGDKAELRELKTPRGIAVVRDADGRELIAIADTGNQRVVIWDASTRFVAQWKPEQGEFQPVAVAADPAESGAFFVLERGPERGVLHRLRCAGDVISETPGFPFTLDVGDSSQGPEMGLAAAQEPGKPGCIVAVTDARRGRVLELTVPAGGETKAPRTLETVATHGEAIGTFVGDAALHNPTDVAYTVEEGALRLYAVDGHNRVVRLR